MFPKLFSSFIKVFIKLFPRFKLSRFHPSSTSPDE